MRIAIHVESRQVALNRRDIAARQWSSEGVDEFAGRDVVRDVEQQGAERAACGLTREAGERPRARGGGGERDYVVAREDGSRVVERAVDALQVDHRRAKVARNRLER